MAILHAFVLKLANKLRTVYNASIFKEGNKRKQSLIPNIRNKKFHFCFF